MSAVQSRNLVAPASSSPVVLHGSRRPGRAQVKVTASRASFALRSSSTTLRGQGVFACATIAGGAAAVRRRKPKRFARTAVALLDQDTDIERLSSKIEQVTAESAKLKHEVVSFQQSLARTAAYRPEAEASAAPRQAPPSAHPSAPSASGAKAAVGRKSTQVMVPSNEVLDSMFDLVCGPQLGSIGMDEMYQVIDLLNLDYNLGLAHSDAPRLMALFEQTSVGGADAPEGRVTRVQFVTGVSRLASALERLGAAGFGLLKMKSVLVAVFERFDVDKDGTISEEEFMAGLALLGLNIGPEDACCLHKFFCCDDGMRAESLSEEPPLEEKIASVFQGTAKLLADRFNLGSFSTLMENVGQALAKTTSSPQEKLQKCIDTLWEESEEVCDAAEGAVEMASLAVGLQYLAGAAQSGLAEGMDLEEVAPFVILLAAFGVKINKDLSELVPRSMTEDEALLYWGVFQKHGLSQASFARLMALEGCSWGTAEAGDILSEEEENSLRIIVKGSVAVEDFNGTVEELPNNMLVGETTYLGGARLWKHEAIVAQGPVTYVHLDIGGVRECLAHDPEASSCMMGLLTESLVSNSRLASRLRAERTVSDDEEAPAARQRSRSKSFDEVFNMLDLDDDGFITREELRMSMDSVDYIFSRLGFQVSDGEFDRVFRYLDRDGNGVTTRDEFTSRLRVIEDWNQNLAENNMTLANLSFVLVRAHNQIDENGDGQISQDEFWSAVQRLSLPLDRSQSNALHSYLDRDGDGLVDVDEWQASSKELQVMAAFRDIMSTQAEKKGLTKFAYFSRQMQLVLQGPEEPVAKIKACLDIAWDGIESLGDVASVGLDVSGYLVAMIGISQQISGIEAGEVDNLDLAPFVLFLGVSAVQLMRKFVEDSAKDLADREALLYTKAFETTEISLSDFRKLMRHGAPRWETFPKGSVLMRPEEPDSPLRVVMQGSCNICEEQDGLDGLCTRVENGGFICNTDCVSQAQGSMSAVTNELTTTLTWPTEKLRPFLERNADIRRKLQRAITQSMATGLLGASTD